MVNWHSDDAFPLWDMRDEKHTIFPVSFQIPTPKAAAPIARKSFFICILSARLRYRNDVQAAYADVMARPSRTIPTAPKRRPGRTDFARVVREAAPVEANLPLTHITDAYSLRDIVDTGELGPQPCRVFEEPLVYLFYGRPAYRVAAQLESTGLDAYWPICFVMRREAVVPKRIYPFDSGAFHHGRFSDFMHGSMIKEDFELDIDPSTPGRLLNLFWPNAASYFDNRRPLEPEFDPFDFEAKAYSELVRARGANAPFDERHSAIEIQTEQPLELAGNLLAVILPTDFASKGMAEKFEALGAVMLPFNTVGRHGPDNMVGQIYDMCRDLYSGKHGRGACW